MYKYTKKNLLSYIEKYQYSEYIGSKLFEEYIDSRKFIISLIKEKSICKYEIISILDSYVLLKKQRNNITIDSFFIDIIKNDYKDTTNLFILIQRFEVSKRLFETYDMVTFKRSSDIKVKYIFYLVFAFIIIEIIKNDKITLEKKTILYNSLLKVCDIIVSVYNNELPKVEKKFIKYILEEELNIYQSFVRGEE